MKIVAIGNAQFQYDDKLICENVGKIWGPRIVKSLNELYSNAYLHFILTSDNYELRIYSSSPMPEMQNMPKQNH